MPPLAVVAEHLQKLAIGAACGAALLFVVSFFVGGTDHPCLGPVQPGPLRYLARDADGWDLASHICCHNTQFAEPSGYFENYGLFTQLSTKGTTIFYDSVCGIPLFEAPIGRSFADWHDESRRHGWPSFRPEEIKHENVIIHTGGEMASICGTHLGHNLPDFSGDRYCIDLVCIAGREAKANSTMAPAVTAASESDPLTWLTTGMAVLAVASFVSSVLVQRKADHAGAVDKLLGRSRAAAGAGFQGEPEASEKTDF